MRTAQDLDVLNGDPDADLTADPTADADPTSGTGRFGRLPLALAAFVVVVVVDRLTKMWAESRLEATPCTPGGDQCIDLVGSLRFHLVYNPGAAFSTGEGLGPVFGVIAVVMTFVLLNMARTRSDRLGGLVLGVIAGGAVGNLLDRIVRAEDGWLSGSVIDFVDLQWWPVWNVADAAVVVGVIVFIFMSLLLADDDGTRGEPADGDEGGSSGSSDSAEALV